MPRKANIIAIIGYANYDFLDEIQRKKIFTLGYELGKSLIDNGYIIATGGLGGVMKDVSQGARDSKAYKQGCILGILPNYDSNQANDFVDIALPTGFDVGRNITLVSIAKAVIMLGGGAGSLNEVALAWQLQKLIIALGDIGWAGKLADMPLDSRRNDRIFKASSVSEVLELLQTKILLYQRNFSGIKNTSSREKALHTLTSTFTLKDIEYLGGGSEGHCFKAKLDNHQRVFKVFTPHTDMLHLSFHLRSLSFHCRNSSYSFEVHYEQSKEILIISYCYRNTSKFTPTSKGSYITLLNECYMNNIMHLDISPKNLVLDSSGALFICDIGKDLIIFEPELFESMCRRVFAIYLLQDFLTQIKDIKVFLSPLNTSSDFRAIKDFLQSQDKDINIDLLYKDFKRYIGNTQHTFLTKICATGSIQSLFDYGCGNGKIAKFLQESLGKKVSAFDIDSSLFRIYQANFQHITYFDTLSQIHSLIAQNVCFDSVLCSLVLCAIVDNDELESVLQNCVHLSKKHLVVIICNPLFSQCGCHNQEKYLDTKNFLYSQQNTYQKKIHSTQNIRTETHRPLLFYEALFAKHHLHIKAIYQSNDSAQNSLVTHSKLIAFELIKDS